MLQYLVSPQFQGRRQHIVLDSPWLLRQRYAVYLGIAGKFFYLMGDSFQQDFFKLLVSQQVAPVAIKTILPGNAFPIAGIQDYQCTQDMSGLRQSALLAQIVSHAESLLPYPREEFFCR